MQTSAPPCPSLLTNIRVPAVVSMEATDPWVPGAWLCLLLEAKPPSCSPRFQFHIHTLKTFGKSESSLAICLIHLYYVCNKQKSQEEIESTLQIMCCSPLLREGVRAEGERGQQVFPPCSCSSPCGPGKGAMLSPLRDEDTELSGGNSWPRLYSPHIAKVRS